MADNIGTAYVEVRADTSQVGKDVDQGVTKATQTASKNMGKLQGNIAAVGAASKIFIAGAAVSALGKVGSVIDESVQAYQDLNESQNAVNVAFGESADEILKLGESAATSLGLSNAEFNQLSVSVSAFTDTIAGALGQEVPATVDDLTTRIADFASVMNLDVAQGFEIFRSGLAGESEPLRKFGIDVSAATVEQVALAEGLVTTAGEMTEADKVTARYLAIMQQTEKVAGDFANTSDELANSLRIQAAQIEDNKAKAGEALAPFKLLQSELSLLGSKTLGILATGWQQLFGDLSDADAALQEFSIHTGSSVDTLAELVTVNLETGVSFEDLFEKVNLTSDALVPLTEAEKEHLIQLGYTKEEVAALSALMQGELTEGLVGNYDNVVQLTGGYEELTPATQAQTAATEEETDAIDANIEALQAHRDAMRAQIDPFFALVEASNDLTEAQDAVTAAAKKYGENSPEYAEALRNQVGASLDLKDAQAGVAEQSGVTEQTWRDNLLAMGGLTEEQVDIILAQLEAVNAFTIKDKVFGIKLRSGSDPNIRIPGVARAEGGSVGAGQLALVGEDGPELIVPDRASTVIPNNKLGFGSVNIEINISGSASRQDGVVAGEAAADAFMQRLSREGLLV